MQYVACASSSSPTRRRASRAVVTLTDALVAAVAVVVVGFGLALPAAASDFAARYAGAIEDAHGLEHWSARPAVRGEIVVEFGGQRALAGTLLTDTAAGRMRIELEDGTLLVFDGEKAWVSPADAAFQQARFHLRTWPYFLAAPFKLRDPGTHLEDLGDKRLDERTLPAARLTFGEDVGDTPDDWYVLYKDPESHRLEAMAYIVTYGQNAEKAEEEPHAITYGGYEEVGGALLSTQWRFWNWSPEEGIHGDPLGEAKLEGLELVEPAADAFEKPDDAREDALPAS